MELSLKRMSSAGNAFYLALDAGVPEGAGPALARAICAGWGGNRAADGLILAESSPPLQRMFNPDGSEGMCANGLRCLARLMADAGKLGEAGEIETCDGPKRVLLSDTDVSAELGTARDLPNRPGSMKEAFDLQVGSEVFSGYGVYVGNPHFVLFGNDALLERVGELGPNLGSDAAFPDGANIEFANRGSVLTRVRVWERGVGETLSCGTGAVAVANAGPGAIGPGETQCLVYPGGELTVSCAPDGATTLGGSVVREGDALFTAEVESLIINAKGTG